MAARLVFLPLLAVVAADSLIGSLVFDGVSLEISPSKPVQDSLTIELLIKPFQCGLQGVVSQSYVLHDTGVKPQAPSHGRGIAISAEGVFHAWSRDQLGVWRGVALGPCSIGQWTHVALVQRGNTVLGYKDGVLKGQIDLAGTQAGHYLEVFHLGEIDNSGSLFPLHAALSDIRIWDVARSTSQLGCNVGVSSGTTFFPPSLVSYLIFNEGYGNSTADEVTRTKYAIPTTHQGGFSWLSKSDLRADPPKFTNLKCKIGDSMRYRAVRSPGAGTLISELTTAAVKAAGSGAESGALSAGGTTPIAGSARVRAEAAVIEAAQSVSKNACPQGCSGHGRCHVSSMTCFCYAGWVGKGCHIPRYSGYALSFSGKSGGQLSIPALGSHYSFSMELWFAPGKPQMSASLRSDTSLSVAGAVRVVIREGVMGLGVAGNQPPMVWFKSAPPLRAGTWRHVAITYSKHHANRTATGSATLYVDGRPTTTRPFAISRRAHLGASQFGGDDSGGWLTGDVDEVRFWGRALSPSDVAAQALGRITGLEKPKKLLAYYRFDDGSGLVATDMATKIDQPGNPAAGKSRSDAMIGGGESAPKWVFSNAPFAPCPGFRSLGIDDGCGSHGLCKSSPTTADTHCLCDAGHGGSNCAQLLCARNCSGHGDCIGAGAGSLGTSWPARLPALKTELSKVKDDVSRATLTNPAANQSMDEAAEHIARAVAVASKGTVYTCQCSAGWSGADCGLKECPRDCSGHGQCNTKTGECTCVQGYTKADCGILSCPGDSTCSSAGICVNGTCICDAGRAGEDCSLSNICPNNCSHHGTCVNGECECEPSYTGDDCSWSTTCPNFCSGRGVCEHDRCVCDIAYTGIDCSEPRCPGDCMGNGDCLHGVCVCEAGWSGEACHRPALWPLKCRAVRSGANARSTCVRGSPETNVPNVQVLRMKFSTEPTTTGGSAMPSSTFAE